MSMNRSFPERRPFFLLVLILASLLILMSHQVRTGQGNTLLEDSLLNVSSPLVKGASGGVGLLSGLWQGYVDLRGARGENLALKSNLERMEEVGRVGEEFRRENLRLRDLLELQRSLEIPSLAAAVVSLGVSSQARTALINRGSKDGVKRDMPVISRKGVVGRIIAVGSGMAKVQLLIDPNSGVAGIFQRSRGQGMVVGVGDRGCRMDYVSDLEDVAVGDVVVTSGLDEIYPKGVTVGVVFSVAEGDQLTKNIFIRPEVDFRHLEEVLVLLTSQEAAGHADLSQ
ncbi:MAG: rod shape-determining protein MreC [Acidobacteria bacterium]|nr:rod shape-determining protein MreC [Acidobacteriota bacterium]MCI0567931.1 rod shape-determining protein MreC [Acidobacteriota bacterium]